jgi:hypothetical protein
MKRARAKVTFYHKLKGYDSQVVLDTDKLSNIGFTKDSLHKYIEEVFLFGRLELFYHVEYWKVTRK